MRTTKNDLNQTIYVKPSVLAKERKWYVVDAAWQTLGKVAVVVSNLLQGKHKAHQWDAWDAWDFVVVKNISKIVVTWRKDVQKIYYHHTWYRGHLREMTYEEMMIKHPERVIELAVKGMLPKNKLRAPRLKRLKTFADDSTKYDYFNPETVTI